MRNWALVEALLEDKDARVKYLFVCNAVRSRLLAYAAKKKVPKELLARATAAMMNVRDADAHDDHIHVRIACPETMQQACVEEPSARAASGDAAEPAAGAPQAAAVTPQAAPSPTEKPPAAP